MGLFGFLFAWYNLPFVVALGCCLILALMQVLGGVGDHDADAHVDLHADAHADVDAHADLDAAAHTHLDGGAHASGGDVLSDALAALGIGRVPLMLVLILFLALFGAIGLLTNTLLANALPGYPALAFFAILPASLLLGLWLTSRAGGLFAKLAPNSSTAISFEQLVGRVGVIVSPAVSSTYGRVQVKDGFGTLHTVYAVVEVGEPLPEHSEVALVGYDARRRCFVVRNLDRIR
jgi:membrane protein implicated in regulation of membrane protease activity